jgi:hypothetical protein
MSLMGIYRLIADHEVIAKYLSSQTRQTPENKEEERQRVENKSHPRSQECQSGPFNTCSNLCGEPVRIA